jgi:hypothetical protein
MDPVSVVGLIGVVQQLTICISQYVIAAKGARKEINRLCSELFALKGALEHISLNVDALGDSPIFNTAEFTGITLATAQILRELQVKLDAKGSVRRALQALTWPLKKDEIADYMQRLERLKTYYVVATTTNSLDLCREIYLEVQSLSKTLKTQVDDTFRQAVVQWLAPFDPSVLHEKLLAAHEDRTGEWFLNSALRDWTAGGPTVLWVQGKPGIGKSTLLSAAIDRAQSLNHTVAYFYCSFTDLSSQKLQNILGSMITQICRLYPELWHIVDPKYREARKGMALKRLSVEELQAILKEVCSHCEITYLFLDAPNETDDASEILLGLWDILSNKVKLLLFSTESLHFSFPGPSVVVMPMNVNMVGDDIETYIDTRLSQNRRLQGLSLSLKFDIKSELLHKADGTFRWVQCQLELLAQQRKPTEIRRALQTVPPTLEETYCNILLRIPQEDRALAREVLMWLTIGIRAMHFDELCDAVVVEEDTRTLSEDDRLLNPEDILHICQSLVSYNAETGLVTLAHSSVPMYLTSQQIQASPASFFYLDPAVSQDIITRKCLTYLLYDDFARGYLNDKDKIDQRFDLWPLLNYCAVCWPVYAGRMDRRGLNKDTQQLALRLFNTAHLDRRGNLGVWIQAYLPDDNMKIENATALYYASRFGLYSVVKLILLVEGPVDMEVQAGRRGSTPMHCAAAFGLTDIVELLLQNGADAKETNIFGESGLMWAVGNGHNDVVELLLDAGADPLLCDANGCNSLEYLMRSVGPWIKVILRVLEDNNLVNDLTKEQSIYVSRYVQILRLLGYDSGDLEKQGSSYSKLEGQ